MSDAIPASEFISVTAQAVADGCDGLERPWFAADLTYEQTAADAYVVTLRHNDGTVQRFRLTATEILPRTTAVGVDV